MNKISRFVIWLCSKFNREELEKIVKELSDILANRNPDVKPKDDFKQSILIIVIILLILIPLFPRLLKKTKI